MPTTIVLADDHKLVRQGIRSLLEAEPDLQLIGEAGNGLDAVIMVERLQPEVLVLDLMMPGLGGVDVARRCVDLGRTPSGGRCNPRLRCLHERGGLPAHGAPSHHPLRGPIVEPCDRCRDVRVGDADLPNDALGEEIDRRAGEYVAIDRG